MDHIDHFLYVRHGQTDWNAKGLLQFQSDIPLNETGRAQAREAGKRLTKLKGERLFFITSPYVRANETAQIILNELNGSGVHSAGIVAHEGLKERFGGTLNGKTFDELMTLADIDEMGFMPCGDYVWDSLKKLCPLAECSTELVKRMQEAIHAGYQYACNNNAKLVVVGHYGSMNTFSRHILGWEKEFYIQNATPYKLLNTKAEKGSWSIEEVQ
ncbi:MAG: hypothetical protein CMF61_05150 [Magnetococcales bacterium]|nr:hypothetical protein [Magnetococcales bacterium]|tara:strand:- start:9 stop:650 length:642 start_codon:yes stop_codon:yes gene_type:complete